MKVDLDMDYKAMPPSMGDGGQPSIAITPSSGTLSPCFPSSQCNKNENTNFMCVSKDCDKPVSSSVWTISDKML